MNAIKLLAASFGSTLLSEITPAGIEDHQWRRLNTDRRVRTKLGIRRMGKLKPSTVHQELRVLTRILNVAVQQSRLTVNPCNSVEFPVPVSKSIRKPHYMTAAEQTQIEFCAPAYLRNAIVILVETGLRPFKELMPMKKDQVDLENFLVHVPDSKTPSGVGDLPMTEPAHVAFKAQMHLAGDSEYLFPTSSPRAKRPHITSLPKIWAKTLKRARVPTFLCIT
jgi:integrase